jgi:ABC-2 type transport system permease protein
LAIVVRLLSSLVAGVLGSVIGANIKPQQIGLLFSLAVLPISFLRCVYYPWRAHPRHSSHAGAA